MSGSYERVDPYIIPHLQAHKWFEVIVYHIESKLWFDQSYTDGIVREFVERKLIARGDTAFDLGSNSGVITLPMAMLAGPEGHVHAFDPYPWNAAATAANAHINHFYNVTAHAVGVSNQTQRILVNPNDSRSYSESKEQNSQSLDIRNIEEFMILAPSFLKIDIEGAEYDLFKDVNANVFKSVKSAVLEFHPMWLTPRGVNCVEALKNIEKSGFDLHYSSYEADKFDTNTYSEAMGHLFWLKRRTALP